MKHENESFSAIFTGEPSSAPADAMVAKQVQDDLETHSVLVWHPRER
jgi:hypothetical protein